MSSDDDAVQDQDPPQDRNPANNEDPVIPTTRPPATLPGCVITPPPSSSRQDTSRTEPDPLVLERRRLTAERLPIQAEVTDLERQVRELSAREQSMRTIDQTGSMIRSINEADERVYALNSLQVSEMLVTLNANPLGSSDVLRDRLLRALKRNIDPETVWTLEDQPITRFSDEITDKGVHNLFILPPRCGEAATTTMTTTTTITTMATGLLTVKTTPTSTGGYRRNHDPICLLACHRGAGDQSRAHEPPEVQCRYSFAYWRRSLPARYVRTRLQVELKVLWTKLEPFLRRLEECQVTCGLNDADVLAVMPLVFTGAAKPWWTHMKGAIESYDVLCQALRERFGEPDIECRLLGKVVNRTQGPLEAGLDYLDSLLAVWALVGEPLPVRLQLNFTYNNLRSEYHVMIHREDFSTFGELYRLVRDYDRPRRQMQPCTPVTPNESVMPELAYQPD
ncbi:hypothetical protein KQX54_012410 [Cotesia glomerata]|uniref:Retrotransposon gag domain-containing protein n=1 Tax=Cotesia glomerata TaxID=32391 RepID=A0AAV7IGY4_COTGL|nr:hypothetical protein KQX54_012410 [Cotesia glomerata]